MPAKKVYETKEEGSPWRLFRTCIQCIMKERNCTEQEAIAYAIEECPGFKSKLRRAEKFQKARTEAKEHFPSMTSYKEIRNVSLGMLQGLVSDFLDIFAIKSGHLDQLDEKLAEQKALISNIKAATTSEEAR